MATKKPKTEKTVPVEQLQEKVQEILNLHENGGILCPDPSLRLEDKA